MTHIRSSELAAVCVFALLTCHSLVAQSQPASQQFPYPEKLTYLVEWRLMDAGSAVVQLERGTAGKGWHIAMDIQSAGLVSRLYRVADTYDVSLNDHFCLASAKLDAQEGKKHNASTLNVQEGGRKLTYEQKDLIQKTSEKKEQDIAPCTYEIAGALAVVRTLDLAPGKSKVIPITNGKKFTQARIEALTKENVTVDGKKYATTRYEAYLFDNVLYKRRGRLLIWVADAPSHLPVQMRLLLGFPVGTITVSLQKSEN